MRPTYRWFVQAAAVLLFSQLSWGAGALLNVANTLPTGTIYPGPTPLVFPGFNVAAGVNPAALAIGKKMTNFQATAAPALQTGDPMNYLASLATSSQKLGWSLGYLGATADSIQTHGLFSGVGFKLDALSLGVGLRDSDLSGGFSPNIDVGAKLQAGNDFAIGAVAYGLDSTVGTGSMGAAAGIGFGRQKKENVELNFLIPSLNGGSDYVVTFAATVYSGIFGTTFRSSYYTGTQSFNHTLGGMIWIGQSLNVLLQLNTPRTLSLGFTYLF